MPIGQVEGVEPEPENRTAHQVDNGIRPAGGTGVHVLAPGVPGRFKSAGPGRNVCLSSQIR